MSSAFFLQALKQGYQFKGVSVKIGRAMLNSEVVDGADISITLLPRLVSPAVAGGRRFRHP